MTDALSSLLNISVIVFAISSMFGVGLGHTLSEVLGPLRRIRPVLLALVANFVVMPLFAILVLEAFSLPEPHAIGIFLVATAAGAPFLIKLAQAAESDVALSAALLMLLLPITVIYMPLMVPLVVPEADVSMTAIALPLSLTMLLPLLIGLLIRNRSELWPARLGPGMSRLSTISLVVLIATTVLTNFDRLREVLFTTSILAAFLVIGGAFVIGYLLGVDRSTREVLALGTAQRNIAAATVVATQAVGEPETVVIVIAASLIGFVILFPMAGWLRKRSRNEGQAWAKANGPTS